MSGDDTAPYRQRLTALQADFLAAFFANSDDFFLTGGAALIGFYGLSRLTNDLDLFTLNDEAYAHSEPLVRAAAKEVEADLSVLRAYPHFRRYLLQRQDEVLDIDLVCDVAPQLVEDKPATDGIRVDSLEEIAVNKVCAIVGRSEVRDFWDLYHLIHRGHDFETLIEQAGVKDGGVNLESVVYVLSGLKWPVLQRAAERVDLGDFGDVAAYFQRVSEQLALRLLPPPPQRS